MNYAAINLHHLLGLHIVVSHYHVNFPFDNRNESKSLFKVNSFDLFFRHQTRGRARDCETVKPRCVLQSMTAKNPRIEAEPTRNKSPRENNFYDDAGRANLTEVV